MLGTLNLPLTKKKSFVVFGGPYDEKPYGMFGVKMAKEIHLPADVDIPTRDFHVPDKKTLQRGINATVKAILAGENVYVGCMGGRGRTGLFLSILAKAFGQRNPVEYVRKNYYHQAVETTPQYRFVTNFPIPLAAKVRIKVARFFTRLRVAE